LTLQQIEVKEVQVSPDVYSPDLNAGRRSAIVTGGSAGIGLATARVLAELGWDLTLVGRDAGKLERGARSLAGFGRRVAVHSANLADRACLAPIVDAHLGRYAGLDLLANNAGVGLVSPIAAKSAKHLDLEMSLNFTSAYLLLQLCIEHLKRSAAAHGASWVVNVSSLTARQNPPNGSVYAASKAALISLSHTAHAELSRFGVHVTALLPGFVDTPGTAWAGSEGRESMVAASDVGQAVRFLLSTSPSCFVPELMLTTAGPGVLHSPIDWEGAAT
jgi:NAD(P)-dependent dehydrogenase (short-subunit alcohol dehydrogenase family)